MVATTCSYAGLRDLYCAFSVSEDPAFELPGRFLEISALEKLLKSVLLFHRHRDYEGLDWKHALDKVSHVASKTYGHNFKKMLSELVTLGLSEISVIYATNFDGYDGNDLVDVLFAAYMETRYPMPESVADRFPIGQNMTHDPLHSSGMTRFAYAVCGVCVRALPSADSTQVLQHLHVSFRHRNQELHRFARLFVEPHCGRSLPPLPDDLR